MIQSSNNFILTQIVCLCSVVAQLVPVQQKTETSQKKINNFNRRHFHLFLPHLPHLPFPHCRQFWVRGNIGCVHNLQFCTQQLEGLLDRLREHMISIMLQPEKKKIEWKIYY